MFFFKTITEFPIFVYISNLPSNDFQFEPLPKGAIFMKKTLRRLSKEEKPLKCPFFHLRFVGLAWLAQRQNMDF
jgi:hypothetical protein